MHSNRDEHGADQGGAFRNMRSGASLYDPRNEHDACGVGFIAQINGRKSHKIIREAI